MLFKRSAGVLLNISLDLYLSHRNHRTIKRGGLDELVGDVAYSPYTSYHLNAITQK